MKIPKRYRTSRWEGKVKWYTKDCDYYRKTDEEEYCGWGVAFKILSRGRNKLRKCEFRDKKDEEYNLVKYLDEVINQNQ